jgi:hypothetical protein
MQWGLANHWSELRIAEGSRACYSSTARYRSPCCTPVIISPDTVSRDISGRDNYVNYLTKTLKN